MAYFNGQHFPFILTNTGGGNSAYRVKYYEEIDEEQKALEIAYLQGLINSESDFSIEVVLGSSIYPAAYTLTDGVIDIYFNSEYGKGFYFIHCAPALNELVYGFEKWNVLPDVTTENDGEILSVVGGEWAAVKIETAEGNGF